MSAFAVLAEVSDRPGILSGLTKVLADHHANITYVDIHDAGEPTSDIYFEFTLEADDVSRVLTDMQQVSGVRLAEETPNFARIYGIRIISLNQAGSVAEAADLVVSDPVQAGVMAVMAVADTAKFDLMRQLKRRY